MLAECEQAFHGGHSKTGWKLAQSIVNLGKNSTAVKGFRQDDNTIMQEPTAMRLIVKQQYEALFNDRDRPAKVAELDNFCNYSSLFNAEDALEAFEQVNFKKAMGPDWLSGQLFCMPANRDHVA